jgi:amino acid transporter
MFDRTKAVLRMGAGACTAQEGKTVPTSGKANENTSVGKPATVGLRRCLTLPYAVLYCMGVTIGAGIYVLIGAAAARAAMKAPLAFVAAAMLMALTAASFAELATRMPVAASEAAYVREASGSDRWSAAVGFLVIAIAVVAAAAITVGSAGYIAVFVSLPQPLIITAVVLGMGVIAACADAAQRRSHLSA